MKKTRLSGEFSKIFLDVAKEDKVAEIIKQRLEDYTQHKLNEVEYKTTSRGELELKEKK
jgi:hypothetical protein